MRHEDAREDSAEAYCIDERTELFSSFYSNELLTFVTYYYFSISLVLFTSLYEFGNGVAVYWQLHSFLSYYSTVASFIEHSCDCKEDVVTSFYCNALPKLQ